MPKFFAAAFSSGFSDAMDAFGDFKDENKKEILETKKTQLRSISPVRSGKYRDGHKIKGDLVGNAVDYSLDVEERHRVYEKISSRN